MQQNTADTSPYLCPKNPKYSQFEDRMSFILSRDVVRAQQNSICGKIMASTTIIQFCRDKPCNWERIDSDISSITLRTSCDLLRRCTNNNGQMCRDCDTAHAGLFYNLYKEQVHNGEFKTRIANVKKLLDKEYNNQYYLPILEDAYGHVLLSYNCPIFGYKELIFPIFFEDRVVAVFVVGQIKLTGDDSEKAISESKKNFFATHEDIFDDYIEKSRIMISDDKEREKYSRKAIISHIMKQSYRGTASEYIGVYKMDSSLQIPDVKDSLTEFEYANMKKTICEWLVNLENMLVTVMKQKREDFARDVLERALTKFHKNDKNMNSANPVKSLWDSINDFANEVANRCALEYMVIYGMQPKDRIATHLTQVASCIGEGHPTSHIPLAFLLEVPPINEHFNTAIDSRANKDIFNAFSPALEDHNRLCVVAQSVKAIPAASVAVLVKFQTEALKNATNKIFIDRLKHLVALMSSYLAVHFENEAQEKADKIMRIYKHEMVNLTSDVSRIINEYLGDHYRLRAMSDSDLKDVYHDATNTLKLFQFFSENIGVLLDDPVPPKNKDIFVYRDLINKWARIKRADANDTGCEFKYRGLKAKIYTDPRYSELVIYNVFTNAVKYSYNGTNIHVQCMPPDNPIESLISCVISVTNFSFEIPEQVWGKIFDMGYRMEKTIDHYPEGSGIGLWLAKKVMKLLNGNIRLCKPTWISNYNVPLLNAYVNNPSLFPDITTVTFHEAMQEYDRLQNQYVINDYGMREKMLTWVVSNANVSFTRREVYREIKTPTYAIRFEVEFNG